MTCTQIEQTIAAWKNPEIRDEAIAHPAGMVEMSADDIEGVAGAFGAAPPPTEECCPM